MSDVRLVLGMSVNSPPSRSPPLDGPSTKQGAAWSGISGCTPRSSTGQGLDFALARRQALGMGGRRAGPASAVAGPFLLGVDHCFSASEQGDVVGHGFLQILRPAFSHIWARELAFEDLPESSRRRAALNSTTFGTL